MSPLYGVLYFIGPLFDLLLHLLLLLLDFGVSHFIVFSFFLHFFDHTQHEKWN